LNPLNVLRMPLSSTDMHENVYKWNSLGLFTVVLFCKYRTIKNWKPV